MAAPVHARAGAAHAGDITPHLVCTTLRRLRLRCLIDDDTELISFDYGT